MRNIKLIIEYDGTNYVGWQRQDSRKSLIAHRLSAQAGKSPGRQRKTIQETIEKTLQRILQEKVKVIASGRTDAGVHALCQVVNFKTNSRLPCRKIQEALNALLPDDISIKETQEIGNGFHACYSAKSKLYRYFILQSKFPSAFLHKYSWHIPYALDVAAMRQDAQCLLGRQDFKSFCASGSRSKTTLRTIKRISVRRTSAIGYPLITIAIEADGFLYTMVRTIVGTLVEIGRGRFEKGSLKKILLAKNRKLAGPTAPAQGLFLVRVTY